jgi:hypothetical protein
MNIHIVVMMMRICFLLPHPPLRGNFIIRFDEGGGEDAAANANHHYLQSTTTTIYYFYA